MKPLFALIFACFSTFCSASIINWTGSTSNLWNESNNWDLNRLPNANDSVIIRNSDTVSISSNYELNFLSLHNSHININTDTLTIKKGLIVEYSSLSNGFIYSKDNVNLRIKDSKSSSKLQLTCDSIYLFRNQFLSVCSFEYQGNHYEAIKGQNTFNQQITWIQNGDSLLRIDSYRGSDYKSKLIIKQLSIGDIELAYSDTCLFSDSVLILSNTWGNIHFGNSGRHLFSSTSKINLSQVLKGKVSFKNSIIDCPINWNLTDSSKIELKENLVFEESFSVSVPNIKLDGAEFKKSAYIRKTGYENNLCKGENHFLGQLVLINQGSGDLILATQNGDTYDEKVYIYRFGNGKLNLANSGSNVFKGDIEISSTSLTKFGQDEGKTILKGNSLSVSSNQKLYLGKLDLADLNNLSIDAELILEDSITLGDSEVNFEDNWIHFRTNLIDFNHSQLRNFRRLVLKGSFQNFTIPIDDRRLLSFSSPVGFSAELEYFTNTFETNRFPYIYNVDVNPFDQFEKDSLIKSTVWSVYHSESSPIEFSLELNSSDDKYLTSPFFMKYQENLSSWINHSENQLFDSNNSSFSTEIKAGKNHLILNNDVQVLPVELLSFDATMQSSFIELNWQTASYLNSSHFKVEKLVGHDWVEISLLKTGNSSIETENFSVIDYTPFAINIYRLSHFDNDGSISSEHYTSLRLKTNSNNNLSYDVIGREVSSNYIYSLD